MGLSNIPGLSPASLDPAKSSGERDPDELKKVAKEFEALLIGQILKSMRKSISEGVFGADDSDSGGTVMMELGEQQLARAMASQGGLGLAELVLDGLQSQAGAKAGAPANRDAGAQPGCLRDCRESLPPPDEQLRLTPGVAPEE